MHRPVTAVLCLAASAVASAAHAGYLSLSNVPDGGRLTVFTDEFGKFGDYLRPGSVFQGAAGAPASFMYSSQVFFLADPTAEVLNPRLLSLGGRGSVISDSGVQGSARQSIFTVPYGAGPALIQLKASLDQRLSASSNALIQTYVISNDSASTVGFRLLQYQDIDFLVAGTPWHNAAQATGSVLTVADQAGNAAHLQITSDRGQLEGFAVFRGREPAGFGANLERYLVGGPTHRPGIAADELNVFHSDNIPAISKLAPNDDANHDSRTDGLGDIALAAQWRIDLPPGTSAVWEVTTTLVPEPLAAPYLAALLFLKGVRTIFLTPSPPSLPSISRA
jgi:hypothetical protein